MPEDRIVGVAVLDLREETKQDYLTEFLYVACHCAATDGKIRHTYIPVLPAGSPKTRTCQWFYTIKRPAIEAVGAGLIEVMPSLNWIDVFHNGGKWEVLYIVYNHEVSGMPTLALKGVNPGITFE